MDHIQTGTPERRTGMRQRVLKGAKISFNNGYAALEGVVRNTGSGGVKIALGDTLAVPSAFDLQISGDGVTRRARVCWRSSSELGVALDA